MEPIIKFYFTVYKAYPTPLMTDEVESSLSVTEQQIMRNFCTNCFYKLSEEVSEGNAPFLKYRNSKDMENYLKYMWLNEELAVVA